MGEALHFMLMGFLGAFLYVLMWAKKPENLYSFEAVRHLVVGVIVGYIYSILYSEYSFPNAIMSLVAGWMGVDFIESLVERFKGRMIKS
jgi:hypothetical protein